MDTRHKICIVGAEAWGSAIATAVGSNALKKGFDERVNIYAYDELINSKNLSEVINEQHENIKYLPGIKLPDNLVAVNDLLEATKDVDILIFATDQNFLKSYLKILAGHVKKNAFAVSMIKGLNHMQDGEINLYSHLISKSLGIPCYSMMCASSALEMAQGKLCEITIGCNNRDHAELLSNVIQTNNCKVMSINDVDGVELCGTLKDIISLGAGIIDGLRLGDNARVAALHLGLKEMMRFVKGFYPNTKLSTFFESCGVVNSVAFCYGDKNITFAKNFVLSGKTLQELEANRLNGRKLLGPMVAGEVNGFLRGKNKEEEFPLFTAIHKICQNELRPERILDALRNHPDFNNHTIETMLDKEHQLHDTEIINTYDNEGYKHVPHVLKDNVGSEKHYGMHFQIEQTEVEKLARKLNNLVVVSHKQPIEEFGTENIQISFKNNPQPNVPNISLTLTAELLQKLSDTTNKVKDTSKISSTSPRKQMLTFWYKDLPHEREKLKKRQQQEKLRMAEKNKKLNYFDIADADPDVSTRVTEWTNDNEWLGESQRHYEIKTEPKKEPSSVQNATKKSTTVAKETFKTINNKLPNKESLNIRIRGKSQETDAPNQQVKTKLSAKKNGNSETHSLKVVAATKDEKPVNDSCTETKDLLKTKLTSQNAAAAISIRNKSTLETGGSERQEKRQKFPVKPSGKSEQEFNYEGKGTAMETNSLKENSKQDHVEDSKKGEKKSPYNKTEKDAVQQKPLALDYYKDDKLIEPTEKLLKEQEVLLKEVNELQVTLMERDEAELEAQTREKVKLDRGEVEKKQSLEQGRHDAQLKAQSKDVNEYGKQVKLERDDAEKCLLLEQKLDELAAQSRDIDEFSKEVKLIREEEEKFKLLEQKKDAAALEVQLRDLSKYGNNATIVEREEADKHKLMEQEKFTADLESQFRDLAEYGKPVNIERNEAEEKKLLEQEKNAAELEALSRDLAKLSKQIKLEREDAEQYKKNVAELKAQSKDVADQGFQVTFIERENMDKLKLLEKEKHAADLDSRDIAEHGKPTKIERDEAKTYQLLEEEKYTADLEVQSRNLAEHALQVLFMESEKADKYKLQEQNKFGADLEALSNYLAKQIKLEREDAEQYQLLEQEKNASALKAQSKDMAEHQVALIENEESDKNKLQEQNKLAVDLDSQSRDMAEYSKPAKMERDEAEKYQLLEKENHAADLEDQSREYNKNIKLERSDAEKYNLVEQEKHAADLEAQSRNLAEHALQVLFMESEKADKYKLQEQDKFGADLEALPNYLAKKIKLEREDAEQYQLLEQEKNASALKAQSKDMAEHQVTLIENEESDKNKLQEQNKLAVDLDSQSRDMAEYSKPAKMERDEAEKYQLLEKENHAADLEDQSREYNKNIKLERSDAEKYNLVEQEKHAAELEAQSRNLAEHAHQVSLTEREESDWYKLQKQEKLVANLEALSNYLAKQIKLEREDAEQNQLLEQEKNASELKAQSNDMAEHQVALKESDKNKLQEQNKFAVDLGSQSRDIAEYSKPAKMERDEAEKYQLLEKENHAADLEDQSREYSKNIKLETSEAEKNNLVEQEKNAAELEAQSHQVTLMEREESDRYKLQEQNQLKVLAEYDVPAKIERDEAEKYNLVEQEKHAAELEAQSRNLTEHANQVLLMEKLGADLEALSNYLAKHIKLEREDAEQYQLLEQEKNASELKAQSKDMAEHQVALIENEESDKNKLQEQNKFAVDLGSQSRDMAEYSKAAKMERDEAEKYQLLEKENHAADLEDQSREYSKNIKLERSEAEKNNLVEQEKNAAELEAQSHQVTLMEREESDRSKLQEQDQSKVLAEYDVPAKMERDEAEKYNLVDQEKHETELDAQSKQVSLMESEEADKYKQIKQEREDAEKYQLMEQEKHAAVLEAQSRDLAEFAKQNKLDIEEAEMYQLLEHGNYAAELDAPSKDLAEDGNQVVFMEREETDKNKLQEQEKSAADLDFQSVDLAENVKPAKIEKVEAEMYQLLEQENYAAELEAQSRELAKFTKQIKLDIEEAEVYQLLEHEKNAAELDAQSKDLAEDGNEVKFMDRKQTDKHKLLEQEKFPTDLEAQTTDLTEYDKPLNMEKDEAKKYKLLEQEKYAVDSKDQFSDMAEYPKHNEAHDHEWLNLNKGEGEETNSKKAHKQKLENIEDVHESLQNFESQKDREMYSRKIEDQAWEWLQLREKLNDESKETSKTQAKETDKPHREEQLQQAAKQELRRESTNEMVPKWHGKPLRTGMPRPIAQQPQTTKDVTPNEQQSQPAATPQKYEHNQQNSQTSAMPKTTSTSIFPTRFSNRLTQFIAPIKSKAKDASLRESQLTRFSNTLHSLMQRGQRKPNKAAEKQISAVNYTGKNPYHKVATEPKKLNMHTIEPKKRRSQSPRRRKLLMRTSYPPLNPRVRKPRPPFDARDKEYHTLSNTVDIPLRVAFIRRCLASLPFASTAAYAASSPKSPIAILCSSSPLRPPGNSIMSTIMPRWTTVSKVLFIVQLGIFASLYANRKKNARSGNS